MMMPTPFWVHPANWWRCHRWKIITKAIDDWWNNDRSNEVTKKSLTGFHLARSIILVLFGVPAQIATSPLFLSVGAQIWTVASSFKTPLNPINRAIPELFWMGQLPPVSPRSKWQNGREDIFGRKMSQKWPKSTGYVHWASNWRVRPGLKNGWWKRWTIFWIIMLLPSHSLCDSAT